MELVDIELATKRFTSECTPAYRGLIHDFIKENVAVALANLRKYHGMFDALERYEEWDEEIDLSLGASGK